MTEELKDFDEELTKLCEEIEKGIAKLDKAPDRNAKVNFLQGRITRAKQVLRSFRVEMRELSATEKEPYQKKAKTYNETINKLIQDLNWAQDRTDLMNGGKTATGQKQDVDTMSSDQVLEKGKKIQEDDLKRLDGIIKTVEMDKEIATNTMEKLKDQTSQLDRVGQGVDEVESNLKQAEKQLRSIARRIATDKIFMVLMLLIFLGIVAVIVVSIVKPGSTDGEPDTYN